jgi:hypothetical protein
MGAEPGLCSPDALRPQLGPLSTSWFSFPRHLQRRSTSNDVRDLCLREREVWARKWLIQICVQHATSTASVRNFYMPQSYDMEKSTLHNVEPKERIRCLPFPHKYRRNYKDWKYIRGFRIYCSFATRVSQLKIWHFWVMGIKKSVCRCTFNRYSGITQFAKLPTGQLFCRLCNYRKI